MSASTHTPPGNFGMALRGAPSSRLPKHLMAISGWVLNSGWLVLMECGPFRGSHLKISICLLVRFTPCLSLEMEHFGLVLGRGLPVGKMANSPAMRSSTEKLFLVFWKI